MNILHGMIRVWKALQGYPLRPPAAPVLAGEAGDTVNTLEWDAVPGASSYKLYWSLASPVTKDDNVLNSVTSPFEHTGRTNGVTYYYAATASSFRGESELSNEVGLTPVAAGPAAPELRAVLPGDTENVIGWNPVTGATAYDLYWSLTSPVSKSDNKIAGVTSPYVHTGRTNGVPYYYAVVARNGDGESGLSGELSGTPTDNPEAFRGLVRTTDVSQNFDLTLAGTTVAIHVAWGDGTSNDYNTAGSKSHTYAAANLYKVEVSGALTGAGSVIISAGAGRLEAVELIGGITGIGSVNDMFASANNAAFTRLPPSLFKNITIAGDLGFFETFIQCTKLTALPTDLFQYATGVTTRAFYSTFNGCTGLTSLPADLFRYNTAITTYAFSYTFQTCIGLTSLPADLFRYNTAITATAFSSTFAFCTHLTSLPADLFRYNTAITTSAFNGTFIRCTGLTSLPTGLFQYNTARPTY